MTVIIMNDDIRESLPLIVASHSVPIFQEVADGARVLCGTMVLDSFDDAIKRRVANYIYEKCRSKQLTLQGFPEFGPLLEALKEGHSSTSQRTYQVCVAQQSKLVILQSLAKKFVDAETTKDRAMELINEHNAQYNENGDFWLSDERPAGK